ncbi:MAG: hypothetical protein ACKPKO_54210, partial [Candidatus Fonsibacter sp.]
MEATGAAPKLILVGDMFTVKQGGSAQFKAMAPKDAAVRNDGTAGGSSSSLEAVCMALCSTREGADGMGSLGVGQHGIR